MGGDTAVMTPTPSARRRRKHANPFTIRGEIDRPDWRQIYGRDAPFALDIGCGRGRFVLGLARRHPEWNILGLEIRDYLVNCVLEESRALGLTHVHAVLANANVHLDTLIPDASVAMVALNFPDPWFKKRHHRRRVVQDAFVALLARKLVPGAWVHAVTDYAPLAEDMRAHFAQAEGFTSPEGPKGYATDSTTGILSEREVVHLGRATPLYRMRFVYQPTSPSSE